MTVPPATDPQGQAGIKRRLITGTAGKVMTLAINFGEQILLVPVFLHFWGPDRFADWTVLIAAAGTVTLLDMGLQNYYGNGLQLALSRGDKSGFARMLRQAVGLYMALSAIALVLILSVGWSIDWRAALNLSAAAAENESAILILLAVHFVGMVPFGIGNSVYRAHNDFTLSIMVGNLLRLTLITMIVAGLAAGITAVGLAVLHIIVAVLGWIAMITHQRRRYPDLQYGVGWLDRTDWRDLLSVAPLYALVLAAIMLTTHGTIFLVAGLAAEGSVAALIYRTLRTLIGMVRLIPDQIMHVTGVEIARQYAQQDSKSLETTYQFFSRFAGGLCGAFAGMLVFIAPAFFPIWTLGDLDFDYAVFWPLLAAAALAGPSLAGMSVLFFINRPAGMAGAHIASGVVTLVLCLILIPQFGAAGAGWAVLAAEAGVLSTAIPWQTAKIIGGNAFKMIGLTYTFTGIAFILSAASAWAGIRLFGGATLESLIMAGCVWMVLITGPLFMILLNRAQRGWVYGQVQTRLLNRQP